MLHARVKKFSKWAALVVIVALVGVMGCQQTSSTTTDGPGPVLMGGLESIDSLLTANQGRWVLVNVWATWCRPCVAETPDLVAFAHAMTGQPLTMLGLSTDYFTVDDTTATRKVRDFQAKHAIPYPNLVFKGSVDQLTERLELSGALPTTLLFDPKGQLAEQYIGLLEVEDLEAIGKTIGES